MQADSLGLAFWLGICKKMRFMTQLQSVKQNVAGRRHPLTLESWRSSHDSLVRISAQSFHAEPKRC